MVNQTELVSFLGKLLNRDVDSSDILDLSSGQRARLHSWLGSRGVNLNDSILTHISIDKILREPGPDDGNPIHRKPDPVSGSCFANGGLTAGLGIDIQLVDELLPEPETDPKSNSELLSIVTLRELSYSEGRPNSRETLAGLFAAKESIKKAEQSFVDVPLSQIEILPDNNGAPSFGGFLISISHSGEYVIAVAIKTIEGGNTKSNIEQLPSSQVPAGQEVGSKPYGRAHLMLKTLYQLFLISGSVIAIALAIEHALPHVK